ncbi:hypothetical protein STEG23_036106, partial [Scotinomys teguina]
AQVPINRNVQYSEPMPSLLSFTHTRDKRQSSEFYKVTTEEYQKAAEEVESKFKRYEYHPVCADLQTKILQCYRQNTEQTLSCSALASQYMHCVNHAKQISSFAPLHFLSFLSEDSILRLCLTQDLLLC